ncbi:TonB-dependent receptor [Dyadobacter sp. CY323]|uniref:TonB-dependent receptor n=1 Tax=Dyadobacter sp. CY323 TaxID=2907302 RepID=UPI001F3506F7|nr:TonB-dependent receptor [Dyadobacter sp. CY323]MCE6992471.1 TonB-dependent receptor [Dyadobacter sp. CY323]
MYSLFESLLKRQFMPFYLALFCPVFQSYAQSQGANLLTEKISLDGGEKAEVNGNPNFTQTHSDGRGVLKGTIKSPDGKPASYVNVALKETNKGTVTDEKGYYEIKGLKEGTYLLRVSSVGLKLQERSVTISEDQVVREDFTLAENASELNEVIVTGSNVINKPVSLGKANIRPLDLPQATAVVSSVVITDQQISRLGDALQNVSGVSLTQQRGGVAETFSSRGYSIGIAGSSGSIFKNGMISNTQGFPETSTLESVEVLKGSSALLYGNVSGGLIVNMVTKKPKFDFGGEVSMRAGSYGLYKPTLDLYGPIAKNLAFRVIGTHETAKSYRDVVSTKRTFVNPSLLYKLGSKTDILVQGDYSKQDLTPDNGIGSLNANRNAEIIPSRSRFINTVWAYSDIDQLSGSVNVNHQFNSAWKLNVIGAIQTTDVNSFSSNVPNSIAANGNFARGLSRVKTSEDSKTAQVNLNGNFKTGPIGHQLLVGADYVNLESLSNTFRITSGGKVVTTYDTINILDMNKYVQRTDIPDAEATARTSSPSHRLGFYVQDMISLTEKIKLLGGVRWSYQKTIQTTIMNLSDNTETRGAAETVSNKAFSPKASLVYQPIKTTSIYGSYSNNFTINTGLDIYGAQIKPSIVDQFELGAKNEFFNGKIAANASVYKIINHNMAQMAPTNLDGTVNSNTNIKELTGETTSDGFEIDVNGNLSKNFYFIAGYGYNYMRYTKTADLKGSYIEGERLINNPAHSANATMFYTFDHGKIKGLKVGASGFYTGKRYGGVNNTFGQTPEFSRLVPLTGFVTFDLSAGYSFKSISLLAKVSNIFNELNYIAHDRYSINPIPPRQVTATLSYRF